jgi:hypothetical protein
MLFSSLAGGQTALDNSFVLSPIAPFVVRPIFLSVLSGKRQHRSTAPRQQFFGLTLNLSPCAFILVFLSAHDHIRAPLDQGADPSAMLIHVSEAMGRLVVDKNGGASLDRRPHIRPAAGGMNPLISHPQGRAKIHHHIGRPRNGRADHGVGAGQASMGIDGGLGFISQSSLGWHEGFLRLRFPFPRKRCLISQRGSSLDHFLLVHI